MVPCPPWPPITDSFYIITFLTFLPISFFRPTWSGLPEISGVTRPRNEIIMIMIMIEREIIMIRNSTPPSSLTLWEKNDNSSSNSVGWLEFKSS